MLNGMYGRGSLPVLESMVHFASARQKVIANNIANVDTIGYKTLDVSTRDFEKALARAFEGQRASVRGTWELERHRTVRPLTGGLDLQVRETTDAGILKHTENNVDLDIEMGKLVKNGSLHSLAATLLGQQFSMIRSAISERAMA